jgi:hypothetical protein
VRGAAEGKKRKGKKEKMLKAKSEIPAKDIDAWTKRLETEWTCAQFASGLQVTPHLALEILRKNKETLSAVAKARMILAICLVKRRVLTNVEPLEKVLSELAEESDEWIKVLLACLDKERIGGGPLDMDKVLNRKDETSTNLNANIDALRRLAQDPPPCLLLYNNWQVLRPLVEKARRRNHQDQKHEHFTLRKTKGPEDEEGNAADASEPQKKKVKL